MKILRYRITYLINVWPLLVLLLLSLSCDEADRNFTSFLYDLAEIDADKRPAVLDGWIKKQEEFPIIDGNDVYFIFKEKRELPIYLSGSMIARNMKPVQLMQIIGTDYYYTRQSYPSDGAFEYKFIVNRRHFLDPLNKKIFKGEKELYSLLFMPDYVYPSETLTRINRIYTTLDTLTVEQNISYLYQHPRSQGNSPLIIFLDGQNYLDLAETGIILDNLIETNSLPPCRAIFIETGADIRKILSFLKREKAVSASKIIAGGNGAKVLPILASSPVINELDAIFVQSALNSSDSLDGIMLLEPLDLSDKNIFFSYSHFEKKDSLYNSLFDFFQNKTTGLTYKKYNEGNSWLNWKGHLDDALVYCVKSSPEEGN